MLEEKNDNLPEADGNVVNDSNESVQVETTIAETKRPLLKQIRL
jgi:hypothetical protein